MPSFSSLAGNLLKTVGNTILPGSGTFASGIGSLLNMVSPTQQTQPTLNASFDPNKPTVGLGSTLPAAPRPTATAAPVPAAGMQTAPQNNANIFTTPSGVKVDATTGQPVGGGTAAKGFNTGNAELDSLLNNLPQVKAALGIGVETPEQKAQRDAQTATLNRLMTLQESLLKSGAPDHVLSDLDTQIKTVTDALKSTQPDELLKSQPSFQNAGITQGQLLRESASRADPIARTLSDLVSSRSIIAEQQKAERQMLQDNISTISGMADIQKAIADLSPDSGLTDGMKNSIFTALINSATKDPLDRQIKLAQLAKLQASASTSSGLKLTATQKNRVNQLDAVQKSLDDYRALYDSNVGRFGVKLLGEDAGKLAGAYNALLFQIAQAAGTGALQAADRQVIESMIPNPTTLSGGFGALQKGGKQGGLNAIDQTKSIMANARNVILGDAESNTQIATQAVNDYLAEQGL